MFLRIGKVKEVMGEILQEVSFQDALLRGVSLLAVVTKAANNLDDVLLRVA